MSRLVTAKERARTSQGHAPSRSKKNNPRYAPCFVFRLTRARRRGGGDVTGSRGEAKPETVGWEGGKNKEIRKKEGKRGQPMWKQTRKQKKGDFALRTFPSEKFYCERLMGQHTRVEVWAGEEWLTWKMRTCLCVCTVHIGLREVSYERPANGVWNFFLRLWLPFMGNTDGSAASGGIRLVENREEITRSTKCLCLARAQTTVWEIIQ